MLTSFSRKDTIKCKQNHEYGNEVAEKEPGICPSKGMDGEYYERRFDDSAGTV